MLKTFRKKLEEEISKLKGKISNKDEEFTRTADGLERELEAVRDQMKQSQKDRDRTLKDKETLLEEVKYIQYKPVLSGHSKLDKIKILSSNGSLMKVESIAECSHWGILQFF